jgi:hypothetical protein
MFQNGTYHVLIQLSAFKNVLQVLGDCRALHTKKLRHRSLGHPDGFILHNGVNFNVTVSGVEGDSGFSHAADPLHSCLVLYDSLRVLCVLARNPLLNYGPLGQLL